MATKWNISNVDKQKIVGIFGILISLASLAYIAITVDIGLAFNSLLKIQWYWIFLATAIYLSTFLLRTARWEKMLKNYSGIPFKVYFESIMLGFAGNNLLPAKGGELVRMEYFSSKTGISRVTAFSSSMLIKIIDGFAILLILIVTIWLAQLPFFKNNLIMNITISAASIYLIIIVFAIVLRVQGKRIIEKLNTKIAKKKSFLRDNIEKIYSSLVFLNFDRNTAQILSLSTIIWLMESVVFVIIIYALAPEIDYISAGIVTLAVVNYGLIIPSSPGFVGLFQGLTILSLGLFKICEETALAASIAIHLCQFLPVTLWGIVIFFRQSLKLFYN